MTDIPSDSDAVVYIVDDDETVRRSLERLANTAGHAVETFASAQAFLDVYDPDRSGCLILDICLPGMSGLELQETLAARHSSIPIIVISGQADVMVAVRSVQMGAMDFLVKPFKKDTLTTAIGRAIALDNASRHQNNQKRRSADVLGDMSKRERQVLDGIVDGKSNKVIAADLALSEKTIEYHRSRIMRKMEADSLAELVRLVMLAQSK